MGIKTTADMNPALSVALGRFAQTAVSLERAVYLAIVRLLPITDGIGAAAFAVNSASRNRDILAGLLDLPEVPISDDWRNRLKSNLPKIKQLQEDRNRLLHNVISEDNESLIVMRTTKNGNVAHRLTISEINEWTTEGSELAFWTMTLPHAEYDPSKWAKDWPTYAVKDWPGRPTT